MNKLYTLYPRCINLAENPQISREEILDELLYLDLVETCELISWLKKGI